MNYSIYAALREDVNSGWVWVNSPEFTQRAKVCISNAASRKTVYCEILQIDDNFLKYYNSRGGGRISIEKDIPTLIINEWYRKLLGDNVSPQSKHELQITEVDSWYGKIKSCLQHPQVIVRVATWLGIISVVEGLIGFILGIASLCK